MTSKTRGIVSGLVTGAMMASMALAGIAAGTPALAQASPGAKNLGTFKTWVAWQGTDANGVICYISAAPQSSEPSGANRDPIHFLVIHRKALGIKNEVQTLIGYPYNAQDPKASATIDGKTYPMVTESNAAWLASSGDEAGFVAAMKKGTTLVVKGTSQRGTNTSDTYSLSGVTAAMAEIDKSCA